MSLPLRLLLGLLTSLVVALAAHRAHSLSRSGVLGAVLTGTLILGLGGWSWGLALIAFFVSSSLLTRWRKERKAALEGLAAKGGQRDLGQALANGGLAALLAVLAVLLPHPSWAAAFAGALAAATADTWATEVGTLSPTPPRRITTGEVVLPGTSGGITLLGTLAASAGALFLGAAFFALWAAECRWLGGPCPPSAAARWTIVPLALAGGLAGNLVDSLLGATVQGVYRCPRCGKETERRSHCGGPTVPLRGQAWLTNDGVNFLATLVGAAVAGALTIVG
jgi:uncharacterized protein (TIGR00297 family)